MKGWVYARPKVGTGVSPGANLEVLHHALDLAVVKKSQLVVLVRIRHVCAVHDVPVVD